MPVDTGHLADSLQADADFFASSRRRKRGHALRQYGPICCLLLLVAILVWTVIAWRSDDTTPITLRGSDVELLQPKAAVVMDGIRVGSVGQVRLERGEAVADLLINSQYAEHIPSDVRFKVETLNDFMPGNVGVKILTQKAPSASIPSPSDASLGARSLSKVREAFADDSVLPANTPTGMYGLVAVAVLVGAVALGITWKVARSNWFGYLLTAGAIAGVIYLFWKGILTFEDVQSWVHWVIDTARTAAGSSGGGDTTTAPVLEAVAPRS